MDTDDAALVAKYRLQTYGRRDDEPVQLSARELDALLALADEAIAARAVMAVTVELREAEERTAAELSHGDFWSLPVSKRCREEADVRERWRAALDADAARVDQGIARGMVDWVDRVAEKAEADAARGKT